MPNEDKYKNETFHKNKKTVEKQSDPKGLVEHLATHTQELARVMPNITQGLNTSVMNAQQFLQSKIPQAGSSLPLSGEHKPSRSSMAKFNHYYEVVNDPVSALKHVKEGTLKNEHLEALQAVYPKMYDEMKKKIVEHMDPEKARTLPYGTRLAIGKFMGQPMDASMLPQSIIANQKALSGPRLGSQSNIESGKSTLGGLKELNQANRLATETEQSDSEDDTHLK